MDESDDKPRPEPAAPGDAGAAPQTNPAPDQAAYAVAHALEDLLSRGCLDNAKATLQCYEQRGGHILRLLGAVPLAGLHLDHVQEYTTQRLSEGAARETIRKELCVLRRALDLAYRRGHQLRPVAQLMPRFKTRYIPRKTWLDYEQVSALRSMLEPVRALFVLVAVYTGARLSELERLDWQDISFTEGLVRIRGTKGSARCDRFVALHPRLAAALLPERRVRGPLLQGWRNIRRDLALACAKAGIPKVTPNDLRRTFASWLVQAGESSYVVSQLLGHATSTMVERVYGRLSRKALADAVNRIP